MDVSGEKKKKAIGCNEANVRAVFGLDSTEEILFELVQWCEC